MPAPQSSWWRLRREALALLCSAAEDVGLPEVVVHDAALCADRAVEAGFLVDSAHSAFGLLATTLQMVGVEEGSTASLPLANILSALASAGAVDASDGGAARNKVYLLLFGGACSNAPVSALRVLNLYLQRLGYLASDGESSEVGRGARRLLRCALLQVQPPLATAPPTLTAAAALYCDRLCNGCMPLWPSALAQLSGYDNTSEASFDAAVVAFTGVAASQMEPPSASSPSTPLTSYMLS